MMIEVNPRQTPGAAAMELYRFVKTLDDARNRLRHHKLYRCVQRIEDVRTFMEHHVFAVWDFMCLLKSLQQRLTCVSVPWLPQHNPRVRRLINEIVVEEESDDCANNGFLSHFEFYRCAMMEAGADTGRIDAFIRALEDDDLVPEALERARVAPAARTFVEHTLRLVAEGPTHAIAAAFAFGREEPIPGMFRAMIARLDSQFPGQLGLLTSYLDRHVELDADHHAPMAVEMLVGFCQGDADKWREGCVAAAESLEARIALWDAIAGAISRKGTEECLLEEPIKVPERENTESGQKPQATRHRPTHEWNCTR